MNGTSAVQGQSGIRDDFNYYGSFYFASRKIRSEGLEARRKAIEQAPNKSNTLIDTITPPQYDIFPLRLSIYLSVYRSSPFRFMDLPAEVRKLIFELIAATFLSFDPVSKKYTNFVEIGKKPSWKSTYEFWFRNSFEEYLEDPILVGYRKSRTFTPEQRAEKYSKYIQDTKDFVYVHQEHPYRVGYYMEILPPRTAAEDSVDWEFLEWFRKLANVSLEFRMELGFVIWARSSISCDIMSEGRGLASFLDTNPGAWRGIKKLEIYIGDQDDPRFVDDVQEEASFIACMEMISHRLTLECFTLILRGTEGELMALAAGEGPYGVLANIKKLKVTKEFRLGVLLSGFISLEDVTDDDSTSDDERDELFVDTWGPKIEEYLMPYTLRPQEPQTETQRYSALRAAAEAGGISRQGLVDGTD